MALVLDASTPAFKQIANGVTSQASNTFSPPAGSVIVLMIAVGSVGGTTQHITGVTDSLGSHLTWTNLKTQGTSGNSLGAGASADTEIWYAPCPSAQTNMTVTASWTLASLNGGIVLPIVFTGAATTQNGATSGSANNINTGTMTTTLASTVSGSRCVAVVLSWNSTVSPTVGAGQTLTINGTSTYIATNYWCQIQTATTGGGSITMNDTAPTSQSYAMAAAEILATAASAVAITPVAQATANATNFVTAVAIEGPLIIGAASSQATALVTAPTVPLLLPVASAQVQAGAFATAILNLSPVASALSQAQAQITALVVTVAQIIPTAQAATQASVSISTPLVIGISPIAVAQTQISTTILTKIFLIPSAQVISQVTEFVSAPTVPLLSPLAGAQAASAVLLTAAVGFSALSGSQTQATSLITVFQPLTPSVMAISQATDFVISSSQLAPLALSQTQSSAFAVVPLIISPAAYSLSAATEILSVPVFLSPEMIAQAQALIPKELIAPKAILYSIVIVDVSAATILTVSVGADRISISESADRVLIEVNG